MLTWTSKEWWWLKMRRTWRRSYGAWTYERTTELRTVMSPQLTHLPVAHLSFMSKSILHSSPLKKGTKRQRGNGIIDWNLFSQKKIFKIVIWEKRSLMVYLISQMCQWTSVCSVCVFIYLFVGLLGWVKLMLSRVCMRVAAAFQLFNSQLFSILKDYSDCK